MWVSILRWCESYCLVQWPHGQSASVTSQPHNVPWASKFSCHSNQLRWLTTTLCLHLFTCWESSKWNVPFRVTKPMAGLSVNKHRQTTRPVLGAQFSAKLSTKLCTYLFDEIGNLYLCAESGEGMRVTTNVLGMTAPPLLLLFNPADSHQRCDKVLTYSDGAKIPLSDTWSKMYFIPSWMAMLKR